MKKLLLLALTTVLMTGCLSTTKKLQKQYGYSVEPGNELLDAGMIYTKEKTADGQFRYRTFYNETRQVTLEQYFQDKNFTIAHGPSRSWSDDGQVWKEGNYKDGKKQGQWTEYSLFSDPKKKETSTGMYKRGLRHGQWTTTNSDGKIILEEYYQDGTSITRKVYNDVDAQDSSQAQILPSYNCQTVKQLQDTICGEASLLYFLMAEVNYPVFARDNNIMGTTYSSFMINKQGKIEDIYVINGICNDIKKEVIRVISAMSTWNPGKVGENPASVRVTIPMTFRME